MSETNDGGPVFPVDAGYKTERVWHPGYGDYEVKLPMICGGLSVRDWFAGQALAGMCAVSMYVNTDYEKLAAWAYEQADAMLSERSQERGR